MRSLPYLRLLLLLALLASFTGLIVWLIQSFLDLYYATRYHPILGGLLIGVLVLLLLVFLAAAIYYLFLFRQPAPSRREITQPLALPETALEKRKAAQQNLAQLEAQLAQIQDEVARAALAERSALLAQQLAQPQLKVVVFGTGSAGKTSLVNALLGRRAGAVGATLGTTQAVACYDWNLPGIPQPVQILDCPGILEIGPAGVMREQEAQAQAQAADLLLVVVDGDLRQSEVDPLRRLIALGKRALLILNKADRYTSEERQILLQRLRERVYPLIPPQDVLMAAAAPAPVRVGSQTWRPEPDVAAVRDRVQAVLYAEGGSLALDNALLQSQQLGEEAKRILQAQLRRQAEEVIDRFQWIVTGVVFANPIPAVDLLAIAAINAQMVVELGSLYGCKMDLQQGRELALSLAKTLAGLGLVEGAIQLTTGILATVAEVSVVGFLATAPIQAASAGYLTRIAGKSFIEYFQHNQSWGEGGMQAVVKAQVQNTQKSGWLKEFVREASRRIFRNGMANPRDP
ncbi:GTP-binding protein [Synechococcus sp. R55.7]|uniref:YcjF family protein n=1 Tax=Synechococcus sp. R55.7 TaxID=2964500 RepID=UPI0039C06C73